ncbi:MAG: hypothetical protein OXN81_03090 [Alphaproteobacteria bacterium]|nr:hypothetical protein [Alphaproteobacteria bacterium]
MSRDDEVKHAKSLVKRAEKQIQKSGFDPDKIVSGANIEDLSPWDRWIFIYFVLSKLQLADIVLSCEEFIPDPEDPGEYSSFKTNGAVLVVYENGKPIWHMERHGKEWKNYCFHISFSYIEDVEYKRPLMRLRSVYTFISELKKIDKEAQECCDYFPNPFNPDSDYRFKKNENSVVAYRKDNPVWYLKRENDEWKTHKMIISREPIDFCIGVLVQEVADDIEDFNEVDED